MTPEEVRDTAKDCRHIADEVEKEIYGSGIWVTQLRKAAETAEAHAALLEARERVRGFYDLVLQHKNGTDFTDGMLYGYKSALEIMDGLGRLLPSQEGSVANNATDVQPPTP